MKIPLTMMQRVARMANVMSAILNLIMRIGTSVRQPIRIVPESTPKKLAVLPAQLLEI